MSANGRPSAVSAGRAAPAGRTRAANAGAANADAEVVEEGEAAPVMMNAVQNVTALTFHGNEKYFMDDKHVDDPKLLTRAHVDALEQQLIQHQEMWKNVPISMIGYFSPKAQDHVEDFMNLTRMGDSFRAKKWDELILRVVLKAMYPESVIIQADANKKARIAITKFMLLDIQKPTSWHKWQKNEPVLEQQMKLMRHARSLFTAAGIAREDIKGLYDGVLGIEVAKAFVAKLKTQNTSWDMDLHQRITDFMTANPQEPFGLSALQRIVAAKIKDFEEMGHSIRAAAPEHLIGEMEMQQDVLINAMTTDPFDAPIRGPNHSYKRKSLAGPPTNPFPQGNQGDSSWRGRSPDKDASMGVGGRRDSLDKDASMGVGGRRDSSQQRWRSRSRSNESGGRSRSGSKERSQASY